MNHPFIERLRSERQVIDTVNRAVPSGARPLHGLAPKEVRRWLATLPSDISAAKQFQLERQLLHIAKRIKAHSTASHRGVIWDPTPSDDQFQGELHWITELLQKRSAVNTPHSGTGA